MLNHLGWLFILEPAGTGRLLCIETSDGSTAASLARDAGELFVVHTDSNVPRMVQEALGEQGMANITFAQSGTYDNSLPFADEHFDGVIMVDGTRAGLITGTQGARNAESALHSLLAEVYRVLNSSGYVYVGLRNKYSYKTLARLFQKAGDRDQDRGADRELSVRLTKRVLGESGFGRMETYKLMTHNGAVEEIILGDQYRSAKNSFTFKQRIKQALLSEPLAGMFAPSLGIVATKGGGRPRYLDLLIDELVKAGVLTAGSDRQFAVMRYLILPGKVILSIGEGGRRYGERIVVMPLDFATLRRLQDEARTLEALHDAPLRIRAVIPRFFMEGELCGQRYFVQQEMPGTSVDAAVPSLERMTARAVRLLTDFHGETVQEVVLDDECFGMLFSAPLRRVVETLGPVTAPTIDRIEKIARSTLYGRRFKLVWMHGDFKIENLIFDPHSREISGVIDWDLSLRDGYPLVDLLYLIAYNRVIREGREIEEVILDCIAPQAFSESEQALRDEYVRSLGIGEDLVAILTMMFCIHHVAYRRDVTGCTGKTIENMLLVVAAAEKMMDAKYGCGSLQ